MTFLVTEVCIKCKYTDCVQVCPTDCFHEGANMLVINADECIDCGLCEPECPAKAIQSEESTSKEWLEFNKKYAALWPKIVYKKEPLNDAAEWVSVPNKLKDHFIAEPGEGTLIPEATKE